MKHNDNFKIIYPHCYYGIRQAAKIIGMTQKAMQYKIKFRKIPYIVFNERILIAENILLAIKKKPVTMYVIKPVDYEKNLKEGEETYVVETYNEQTLAAILRDMKQGVFEVVEKKASGKELKKTGLIKEYIQKDGYILEGTFINQSEVSYKCKRLSEDWGNWCLGNYCLGAAVANLNEWELSKSAFLAEPCKFYMSPNKWKGKDMFES